jgi:tetratricopeptide (TPR) repeat protein
MVRRVVMLIVLALVAPMTEGHSVDCPKLPDRSETLERVTASTLEVAFNLQKTKYDRNPPQDITFSQMVRNRRNSLRYLRAANPSIDMLQWRLIAYYLDTLDTQDYSLIPIPRDRFWCVLRPGNSLLLSDGIRHHYTTLYRINTENETLDLLDPWPEKIFLRKGFNRLEVAAQIIDVPDRGKLVRITRDEFERVIIGTMSEEQPEFLHNILQVVPNGANKPRFMLTLAINSLGDARYEDPISAIPYYHKALELVLKTPDSKLRFAVAKEALYAALFSTYWIEERRGKESSFEQTLNAVERLQEQIRTNFPDLMPVDTLTERQLIRLGQISWQVHCLDDAERLFTAVIKRSPNNPAGYFGRAKARNRLLDHKGTIADSSKTIELLQQKMQRGEIPTTLQEGMSAYEIIDFFDTAPERRDFSFMLGESYFLRGNAHNALGQPTKAELDGRALIAVNPEDHQGYMVVAMSLLARAQYHQAVLFYMAAIPRAQNPRLAATLRQLKDSAQHKAEETQPDLAFGYLRPEPSEYAFLFESAASLSEFVEKSQAGVDSRNLTHTWHCFVPAGTPAFKHKEDREGNVVVEVDMSIAGGGWSPAVPVDVQRHHICRGVVPSHWFRAESR